MQVHVTSARARTIDAGRVMAKIRALPALAAQITHNDWRAADQPDVAVVLLFEATDRDDAQIKATLERVQQNRCPTVVFGPWLSRHPQRRKHQVTRALGSWKTLTIRRTLPQVFHWLQQRLPWHVDICRSAAARGDLVGLQWLRQHQWPWDRTVVSHHAAQGGHLHVLRWLCDDSCQWPPFDGHTAVRAAERGHLHVLEWFCSFMFLDWKRVCLAAIPPGHLHVLQWVHAKGRWPSSLNDTLFWDGTTCATAAKGGHGHVLLWLMRQQVPCDDTWTLGAAEGGHLDLLQTLRALDPPCPWNAGKICAAAAAKGHLALLQWVHAQDAQWIWDGVHICAIRGGHLAVLSWLWTVLRDDDDPNHPKFCHWAAYVGELAVLQWLRTQGCFWDTRAIEKTLDRHDLRPQFYQACRWLLVQFPRVGHHQPPLLRWLTALDNIISDVWPSVLCSDVAHLIQRYC